MRTIMGNSAIIILHSVELTLFLTIISVLISLAASCLLSVIMEINYPVVNFMIRAYMKLIRGTPLLLQMFFIYFGLAQSEWIQHSPLWIILKSPISCAILCLANNSMAYLSYTLLGVIEKIPAPQIQAAKNLGLKPITIGLCIKLPYALRAIAPYYKNEVITLLKSSSLASTITCMELSGATGQIISANYQQVKWYSISAGIYLLLALSLTFITSKLIKKFIIAS